jgi:hypothetical protein
VPDDPKHLQGFLAGGMLRAGYKYGAGYEGMPFSPDAQLRGKMQNPLVFAGGAMEAAPEPGRTAVNILS